MKNNFGFSNLIAILLIFLILVPLGYFGYNFYNNTEKQIKSTEKDQFTNNQVSEVLICEDFNDFSDFVSKTVLEPEKKEDYQTIKPTNEIIFYEKFFTTARDESGKPLFAYPIKEGIFYEYQTKSQTAKTDQEIKETFEKNFKLLNSSLEEKTKELGFSSDEISDKSSYDNFKKFYYVKGQSIYSIELYYEDNTTTIDYHSISIKCGRILPEYDYLFDYVVSSRFFEWKEEGEYIRVVDISDDGNVIAVENNFIEASPSNSFPTLGNTLSYYIRNSNNYYSYYKLTESRIFADCNFFESLKVGKGLKCQRESENIKVPNFSKVTY